MSWTCFDNSITRARKKHRCCLCAYDITPGAYYVRRTGIQEDAGICTMHMHIYCERQTSEWDDMDWECFDEGEFRHYEIDLKGIKPDSLNPNVHAWYKSRMKEAKQKVMKELKALVLNSTLDSSLASASTQSPGPAAEPHSS